MIVSPMSDEVCDRYTSGDCYVLAKKLSDLRFGELSSVSVKGRWDCWSHMALKIGPDSYLDIEGIWSAEELMENYQRGPNIMTVIPITDEEYFEMTESQSPAIDTEERLTKLADNLIDWVQTLE